MLHISESATRFSPIEVWETRNPWLIEKVELSTDSCGPGEYRGGPGVDFHFRMLEKSYVTTVVERTKNAPWGLEGGGPARANGAGVRYPDGSYVARPKETRIEVPKDAVVELNTGGGGGYGPPSKRPAEKVKADLRAGYISEAFARRHYPHAF
jgi:N-methylhydantoinase B